MGGGGRGKKEILIQQMSGRNLTKKSFLIICLGALSLPRKTEGRFIDGAIGLALDTAVSSEVGAKERKGRELSEESPEM